MEFVWIILLTVLTVSPPQTKTVKTVEAVSGVPNTQLKQGVNESINSKLNQFPACRNLAECELNG